MEFEEQGRLSPLDRQTSCRLRSKALVEALRAGESGCQLEQSEQITEGQYVRAKCLIPATISIS